MGAPLGRPGEPRTFRPAAPATDPGGPLPWAPLAIVALTGALLAALYVAGERGFPYWDSAFYEEQTIRVAEALGASIGDGVRLVRASMDADYNSLFALPLAPWLAVFGAHRLAFVLAVYFTYLTPFLLLTALLARRVVPAHPRSAAVLAAIAALATPACWNHVLQGYPDVGGAALIAACALLFGAWEREGRWRTVVSLGLVAGLAVVFRRHYLYASAALFAGMTLDAAARALDPEAGATRLRAAVRRAGGVAAAGASCAVVVWLATPGVVRAVGEGGGAFAPWQVSTPDTLLAVLATVGVAPLALAGGGWWLVLRRFRTAASEARLVAFSTGAWVVLWTVVSRQQPYHYPHWLPLFVVLGIVALWHAAPRSPRVASLTRAGIGAVLALGFFASVPLDAGPPPVETHPLRLLPDGTRRLVNPWRDEILRLVGVLRRVARPDDRIVVTASSHALNFDVVAAAERAAYGRHDARLRIVSMPQTDAAGQDPIPALLDADVVVTATPFQQHLGRESQRTVEVTQRAFGEHWPFAADFEWVPDELPMPGGDGEVRVYRRRRPTTPEVARDTALRAAAFLAGERGPGVAWLVESSPHPTQIDAKPDGTFRLTGHPVAAGGGPPTRFRLAGFPSRAAELSGAVSFYDARCPGAEIVLLHPEHPDEPATPVGAFAPASPERAFRVALPPADVWLEVRPSPTSPDDVSYCTLVVDDLRITRDARGDATGDD